MMSLKERSRVAPAEARKPTGEVIIAPKRSDALEREERIFATFRERAREDLQTLRSLRSTSSGD
jgi:hypothetical protein